MDEKEQNEVQIQVKDLETDLPSGILPSDTGSSVQSADSDFDDLSSLSDDGSSLSGEIDDELVQRTNQSSTKSLESVTIFDTSFKTANCNNSNHIQQSDSIEQNGIRSFNDQDTIPSSPRNESFEKKKLSIEDSLFNLNDDNDTQEVSPDMPKRTRSTSLFQSISRFFSRGSSSNISQIKSVSRHSINDISPGSKITYKDGERDEQWDFAVGNSPFDDEQKIKSQKKVLKLELSTLEAEISNSDKEISPSLSDSEEASFESETKDASNDDSPVQGPLQNIHFELRDSNKRQCMEWRRLFKNCKQVKVRCESILEGDMHYDAVIVPGNSFGFLDGEPEIQFTNKFGWRLQEDLQKIIHDEYDGELLVGQAVIVPLQYTQEECSTEDAKSAVSSHSVKYAVYVPVMRVPLHVKDSVNAYLAFRAAIRAVKSHNAQHPEEEIISSILCPPLCDGFGCMPAGRIAAQMRTAYNAFVLEKSDDIKEPTSLGAMATNHVNMTTKIGNWC